MAGYGDHHEKPCVCYVMCQGDDQLSSFYLSPGAESGATEIKASLFLSVSAHCPGLGGAGGEGKGTREINRKVGEKWRKRH